jgi:hypothetical protein
MIIFIYRLPIQKLDHYKTASLYQIFAENKTYCKIFAGCRCKVLFRLLLAVKQAKRNEAPIGSDCIYARAP